MMDLFCRQHARVLGFLKKKKNSIAGCFLRVKPKPKKEHGDGWMTGGHETMLHRLLGAPPGPLDLVVLFSHGSWIVLQQVRFSGAIGDYFAHRKKCRHSMKTTASSLIKHR